MRGEEQAALLDLLGFDSVFNSSSEITSECQRNGFLEKKSYYYYFLFQFLDSLKF